MPFNSFIYFQFFFMILIFLGCQNHLDNPKVSSSQNDLVEQSFNRDSSKTISKANFNLLIDHSILLLETKTLEEITDVQHIHIMMCLNTIFVRGFNDGRYKKLEFTSEEKEYSKNIRNRYPEWIPNRGMGFYFPKLKMEFYGTSSPYAIFDIKE